MTKQLVDEFRSRLTISATHRRQMSRVLAIALLICLLFTQGSQSIFANQTLDENSSQALPVSKLGIHILAPTELSKVSDLFRVSQNQDAWHFVTVPLTLDDLHKEKDWNKFFQQAQVQKIIPIVRLTSRFEDEVWIQPTRKDIVDQINFLSKMPWSSDRRYIIVGNEVNHAAEWGGELDPVTYTNYLTFASQWARSVDSDFFILPAALDLDAPNSSKTREAIGYLRDMLIYKPDLLDFIDGWNSHSYPNPAFSAPPTAIGKNSLRGYQTELALMAEYSDRQLPVFITETGWRQTIRNQRLLANYYDYAVKNVWSDPRVVAVTPFVLQGAPGQFAAFSFLDAQQKPTAQFVAYQAALQKISEASQLSELIISNKVF